MRNELTPNPISSCKGEYHILVAQHDSFHMFKILYYKTRFKGGVRGMNGSDGELVDQFVNSIFSVCGHGETIPWAMESVHGRVVLLVRYERMG